MGNAISRTDSGFGPILEGKDDFTLLFEESIFTIGPSIIAILGTLIQFLSAVGEPRLTEGGTLLGAKALLGAALIAVHIASVTLWTFLPAFSTSMTLPAAIFAVGGSVAVFIFLFLEHLYSYRPSTFLSLLLSVTLLLDIAKTYSCFNRLGLAPVCIMYILACIIRFLLLISQEISKRRLIRFDSTYFHLGREATSGFWNRSLFIWLNSTLLLGFQQVLKVEDLQPLEPRFRAMSLAEVFNAQWQRRNKRSTLALLKACFLAQAIPFVTILIPRLCQSGFTFAQPFLVLRTVRAVAERGLVSTTAGGLLGASVLIYFGIAISKGYARHLSYQVTISLRGMLVGAIYDKMFCLSHEILAESSAVSLMSTDLSGLQRVVPLFHDLLASLVELGFGLAILASLYGAACVLLLIPSIVTTICSSIITKKMAAARSAWNEMIEARITKTSNILAQIKVVKMMGASDALAGLLKRVHEAEIKISLSERTQRICITALGAFTNVAGPVLVIAGVLFWTRAGETLGSSEIFTILTVIAIVSEPMDTLLFALPAISAASASFPRIQRYLCLNEQTDGRSVDASYTSIRAASMAATSQVSGFNLSEINLQVQPGSIAMISGPVGCGKTTLLKAFLGEIPLQAGFIEAPPTAIGYCDQVAWLQNISIRDNICQDDINSGWYQQVMVACALDEDIASLPEGDRTVVGTSASNISGGQKQRVALARAVYSRAPLFIFDDPLSAVDATTTSKILQRLFGEDGIMRSLHSTVIMTTSSRDNCSVADVVFAVGGDGKIQRLPGLARDAKRRNNGLRQLVNAPQVDSVAFWEKSSTSETATPGTPIATLPAIEPVDEKESDAMRKGDRTLYSYYFRSTSVGALVAFLLAIVATAFAERTPIIFMRIWREKDPDNNEYFVGYAALSAAYIIISTMSMWILFRKFVPKTSASMHDRLVTTIMGANLAFLVETDGGSMLNRLSHDMTLISQDLPVDFMNTVYMINTLLIDVGIISAGAKYVAVIVLPLLIVLYIIQYFYLRTSRQLRVRELEAKAPLFTLFTETAVGIQHIRAFRWQNEFRARMQDRLDYSQVPYYSLLCAQRWLTVVMDLCVCAIAALLVGMAVYHTGRTSENAIGLAMVSLVTFSVTMTFLVESCVELEISLGAISRVRSFCQSSPQEEDGEIDEAIPDDWPSSGGIEFRGVSASYRKLDGSSHQVLNNVSFTIAHGKNLGLSGRTGSGKSSILAVLLRMIDYTGYVLINGRDLRTVPREVIRSRIITMTQDPLQLQGTIRFNLDPYAPPDYDSDARQVDMTLIQALEKVGLWGAVSRCGGLETEMSDAKLSQGQVQLLAIARAILRKNYTQSKIILIDEATSSIDNDKDRELQTLMAKIFADCTVIMISHRLYAFDNMQKVVMLNSGYIEDTLKRDPDSGLLVEA